MRSPSTLKITVFHEPGTPRKDDSTVRIPSVISNEFFDIGFSFQYTRIVKNGIIAVAIHYLCISISQPRHACHTPLFSSIYNAIFYYRVYAKKESFSIRFLLSGNHNNELAPLLFRVFHEIREYFSRGAGYRFFKYFRQFTCDNNLFLTRKNLRESLECFDNAMR